MITGRRRSSKISQSDYQKIFDWLRPIADTPLRRFNRPLVVRIRDKASASKGRRFGNYVKAVLSLLFAWGSERDFVSGNPASGIKDIRRKKGAPEANRPWSDQERDAVLDAASDHMRPALALMVHGIRSERCSHLAPQFHEGL